MNKNEEYLDEMHFLDKEGKEISGKNLQWILWKKIEEKPQDDQTVLGINVRVQMLPIKAYYCAEWDEFMSLENGDGTNHPLSLTHWMPLPKSPKE